MNYGQAIDAITDRLRISYRDYRIPLQAGIPYQLDVTGNYWQFVKAAANAEVTITFDESQSIVRSQATGGPASYARIMLLSAVDQVCVFSFGFTAGLTPYDRSNQTFAGTINVNPAVPASNPTDADIAVGAGASVIVAGVDVARQELLLSVIGATALPVRVGDSSVSATRGQPLFEGETIVWDGTAAVYVFNPNAAGVTVTRQRKAV